MNVSWEQVEREVKACRGCPLHETRTNTVFGEGNRHSQVMLIGEGPGAEEDAQGRPFVGTAGKLLDKMLSAIGLDRESVYIANIVKCRPPKNRVPYEAEAISCLPHLRAQFALVRPKIIVCLGATAAKYIIGPECKITRDRGKWTEKRGVMIMGTYHPAALLRDPSKKRDAWEDMQSLRTALEGLSLEQGAV